MTTPAQSARLNVASGTHYADGWTNFDLLPQAQLDLRASIFDLPFPDATFSQVYVGHVCEHIPFDLLPAALTEIRRVTTPGGEVMVVGPDIERAVLTNQPKWLLDAIVKDDPGAGPGGHAWTATGLMTLLAVRTVFSDAAEVPVETVTKPMWPNPSVANWQCACLARA